MNRLLSNSLRLLYSVFVMVELAGCGTGDIWDGSAQAPVPPNANGVYSEQLIVDHGGSVAIVDVVANRIVQTIAMGTKPRSAVALPDNRAIYFPDIGGIAKVGVLDGATNARLEAIPIGDPDAGSGVGAGRALLMAAGALLYTTGDPIDFTVAAIDTTINAVGKPGHGKNLNKIPVAGAPLALADGDLLLYVLTESPTGAATIDVIDPTVLPVVDQRVVESFPLPPSTRWQALMSNGVFPAELYFTNADGLSVFDARAGSPTRGQVIARIDVGPDAGEMALDWGRRLYVLVEAKLVIVDLQPSSPNRYKQIAELPVGTARYVERDPATGALYVANPIDRTLTIWKPDPVLPDTFAPGAPLSLPHVPQGLGLRSTAGADRLYVSMGPDGVWQVDMFDAVFPDGNWTTTKVYDTTASADAVATSVQQESGGDPGLFRRTTHQWTGSNGVSTGLEAAHLHSFANHDPFKAGAIDHVDISFDAIVISQQGGTPGVAIFPLLVQSGTYHQFYDAGNPAVWAHKAFRGLTANDFVNANAATSAGPLNPDFSSNGAPIQFGYGTANGSATTVPMATVSGVDNWNVVLTLR